jgi:hypothetical protein
VVKFDRSYHPLSARFQAAGENLKKELHARSLAAIVAGVCFGDDRGYRRSTRKMVTLN